uniref:Deacetylase sirtuin-type domain-containing protein n=1 Tax=Caenorhabditis tropicalis TaxID=1561998 RepID=A0A1I7T010_9PELO
EWLKERAKNAVIPVEESAIMRPDHIFGDCGPMVIHICHACRKFNSSRPSKLVAEGMMELPMALCTVCRSHMNRQRSLKFFEYELPSVKKSLNL